MEPSRAAKTKAELIAEFAGHARAYQNAAEVVADAAGEYLGLNRTDHRCLDIIERHGPVAASDLARLARLSTKAITTVIDRLEHAGYARRVADPHDRRKVLVAVTEDGRRRAEEAWAPLVQSSRQMLQRYSRAELELLLDYLGRARQVLDLHAEQLRAGSGTGAVSPMAVAVSAPGAT